MNRRTFALLVILALSLAPFVEAREHPVRPGKGKYRAYNIGLTSVFTLVSAVVQHQVHSPRDAVRQLLVGSGAGLGFYEAKRIAGGGRTPRGRTTEGWAIANAVSSIVENSTSGEHLLGQFGYTVGPFRFHFATPLTRNAVARVEADWSFAETVSMAQGRRYGDHFHIRHGMITIDRDTEWPTNEVVNGSFGGRTYGVFPGVAPHEGDVLWQHEVVHAIQQQQLDSVEPPFRTFGGNPDPSEHLRLFAFRHVRLGLVHVLDLPTYRRPYVERWGEVEAYGLAQRSSVPP